MNKNGSLFYYIGNILGHFYMFHAPYIILDGP
jgi:hypothetical protein